MTKSYGGWFEKKNDTPETIRKDSTNNVENFVDSINSIGNDNTGFVVDDTLINELNSIINYLEK